MKSRLCPCNCCRLYTALVLGYMIFMALRTTVAYGNMLRSSVSRITQLSTAHYEIMTAVITPTCMRLRRQIERMIKLCFAAGRASLSPASTGCIHRTAAEQRNFPFYDPQYGPAAVGPRGSIIINFHISCDACQSHVNCC